MSSPDRPERIDALFDRALADDGRIPADASTDERAELEALLETTQAMRLSATQLDAEARASTPIARARFERFIASAEQAALPAPRQAVPRPRGFRTGLLGRLAGHRLFTGLTTAGVIAAVAVFALFISQSGTFTGVDTAEAWAPGDYVQIEGVVSSASAAGESQTLKVSSQFGDVDVTVPASTPLTDAPADRDPVAAKAGDAVVIGGIASSTKAIAAGTLALKTEGQTPPAKRSLQEIRKIVDKLDGHIVSIAISKDGKSGRVVVADANGNHFVAIVPVNALESLLAHSTSAVGANVSLGQPSANGPLSLVVSEPTRPTQTISPTAQPTTPTSQPTSPTGQSTTTAPPGAPAQPTMVNFEGVIRGRDANVWKVETLKGPVQVALKADTKILLGESGLTNDGATKGGTAIGHIVHITGVYDPKTGRVAATIVVLGPLFKR